MNTRALSRKVIDYIAAKRGNLPIGQLPVVGCTVLHILSEVADARHRDVMQMFDGMQFLRTETRPMTNPSDHMPEFIQHSIAFQHNYGLRSNHMMMLILDFYIHLLNSTGDLDERIEQYRSTIAGLQKQLDTLFEQRG